jgi:eukaryotic-like serine/threonine-protein kinase
MTVDPSAVTAALPGPAAPSMQPNETVGKYRLDRPLGSGGMGVVWAAFDPDLERAVALKLLRVEATEEASMRTRLLREARAMARLRHPNVVTVFDVGTDKGRDYIAMELVEGGTLDEWLHTKPTRGAIIEALISAGRGLHAAHAAGLVHRDFKPHNVLRATDGHIYVTDFGLARGQIEEGPELVPIALPVVEVASGSQPRRKRDLILDSPLTQTGVLIGTPAYMAPEQFAGATPDPKSDQFAFCVTAWQALTGERPFRGESLTQIEAAAREGAAKLSAELPPALRAVLVRGLEPSPAARWPDIAALLDALADSSQPEKPKRRWLLPLLAGAVLVGGGVILLAVGQKSKSVAEACGPADAAFAKLWTPARTAVYDGNFGVKIVLQQMRKQWIRSYTAACTGELTVEKRELGSCLRNARDEMGKALDRMHVHTGDNSEIAALTAGMIMCDPKSVRNWGNDFDPDIDIDEPEPPEPPEPPEIVPPKPPSN